MDVRSRRRTGPRRLGQQSAHGSQRTPSSARACRRQRWHQSTAVNGVVQCGTECVHTLPVGELHHRVGRGGAARQQHDEPNDQTIAHAVARIVQLAGEHFHQTRPPDHAAQELAHIRVGRGRILASLARHDVHAEVGAGHRIERTRMPIGVIDDAAVGLAVADARADHHQRESVRPERRRVLDHRQRHAVASLVQHAAQTLADLARLPVGR